MPLQNRVTPDGELVATAARGTIFGNRGGCFHRPDGTLRPRHWANRQWICCVLEFKNRRRTLLQPGLYTELFFLDEATAFAAGHRPCFECRRADARQFAALWAKAHALDATPSAPAMDVTLHAERLADDGRKRTAVRPLASLPDGAIIRYQDAPYLVHGTKLLPWRVEGYATPIRRPARTTVTLLTPPAIAAILQAGYRPTVHPTADVS